MKWLLVTCLGLGLLRGLAQSAPPNVVYFMADELGYFEPSYMGNPHLLTPNIDRLAAEGIKFTQMMAGSAVCAPTRCCFLTGKHSGHTSVRSNGGGTPLRADEQTIASVLKSAGYATGGFGKWGNGGRGSTGVPELHGFDEFFGYYDQVHAHAYYPPYLIRNSEEVRLEANRGGARGTYAHYEIFNAAKQFIKAHKDGPFFAYLPFTPPHGNFDIPDNDPAWALFRDKPWPEPARRYAAMVSMLDRHVGEVLALLKELGLDEKTVVFFSGDNGGADYFASKEQPKGVHGANVNPTTGAIFRGQKGNLYEGGLRVPFAVRWPGHIAPRQTSDLLGYFPDLLPTIADIAGAKPPADIDGISIVPTLMGEKASGRAQQRHEYLYWEFGAQIAVRMNDWKAIQPRKGTWELYDLRTDISEATNLATARPEILKRLERYAEEAHAQPVEGTFASTEMHERDRAAKFGEPQAARSKTASGVSAFSGIAGLLSSKDWKIVRCSSENAENQKFARNAIDGDPATLWHTKFSGGIVPPPHELVIDLGASHEIRGFVYLARQDKGWNGAVKEAELCVSDTAERFGAPLTHVTLAKSRDPQKIEVPKSRGRFVLFRALSEQEGRDFASMAELGLLGE